MIIGVCNYLLVPVTLRVMQIDPPGNMTVAELERVLPAIEFSQKISAYASPVIIAIIVLISAAVLTGMCAVMDLKARFQDNFSLIAHSGLIGAAGYLAQFVVVTLKGDDVQSLVELRPGFGLDLLLDDGANRFLYAVLNYFSLFTVWYIFVLGLTFAFLVHTSKSRASTATAPVWLLGLLFAIVGAFFQR